LTHGVLAIICLQTNRMSCVALAVVTILIDYSKLEAVEYRKKWKNLRLETVLDKQIDGYYKTTN